MSQEPGTTLHERSDGIIHLCWGAGTHVDDAEAHGIIDRIHALPAEDCTLLVDITGMASASRAALVAFATRLNVAAMAVLGISPVDRLLVRFFHQVHRPGYPVRVFSCAAEAVPWLRSRPECRPFAEG